jgi:hypothetical protein
LIDDLRFAICDFEKVKGKATKTLNAYDQAAQNKPDGGLSLPFFIIYR